MSLNYGTLKTKIITESHLTSITDAQAAEFVRQAEGVIYRTLRAAEMITRATLTSADIVTGGIYSLPSDYLEARSVFRESDTFLESVSLYELRSYASTSPVRHYCVLSDREIEFRGVPSTSDEFELVYFARPAAFSDNADQNSILTRHEAIYFHASMTQLYLFTQDLELASAHSDIAANAIENLNQQAGRLLGGKRTRGGYAFTSFGAR